MTSHRAGVIRAFRKLIVGGPISEDSESERTQTGPGPAAEPPDAPSNPSGGRVESALRVAVPGLTGLVLVAYLLGETVAIDHDLRIVAPASALPGARVPVRAFLYGQLRAVEGARLVEARLSASLRDAAGVELSAVTLRPGHGGSYEGILQLPASAVGSLRLSVHARLEGGETTASGPLRVDAAAEPSRPTPRRLRVLQQQSAGPLREVAGQVAPSGMRTVVGGGVCVPEQPCILHVHVGTPAASLAVEPNASVTPLSPAQSAQSARSASVEVTTLRVRTHGPEAVLRLVASRAGAPVARRSVRLPVLLGGGALSLQLPIGPHGELRVGLSGEAGSCIVDSYRDGHWVDTVTLQRCNAMAELPHGSGAQLAPGIWRLQARRDAFSNAIAAVGVFEVPPAGQSADDLGRLAAAARAVDSDDALVAQVIARLARQSADPGAESAEAGTRARDATRATRAYLLAKLEQGVIPLPAVVTSYVAAERKFAERRVRAKLLTVGALVLAGLSLGLLVARRGLVASSQARDILAAAGDPQARSRRRRFAMTLRVLAVMAAILLAFVVVALYVLARGTSPI